MLIMSNFEWDSLKELENIQKHGVSFSLAQHIFSDNKRVIIEDSKHSQDEDRYYCFGKIDEAILTVRFTYRLHKIRIIGAGYWRKGKEIYEKSNQIH